MHYFTWHVAVVSSPVATAPPIAKHAGILVAASQAALLPHSHVPALHTFAVESQATPPHKQAPLLHVKPPRHMTPAHGSVCIGFNYFFGGFLVSLKD